MVKDIAKRSETIAVRVTPDMRAKLEAMAQADRRTVSSLVEMMLERAIDGAEARPKRR